MDKKYIHKFIWGAAKHNKEFYAKIEDKIPYLLNPKSLDNIELIIAEIKKLGLPTKNSKQPFLQNVLIGYADNNIRLFSMNSSSLTLNPNILREKPQYKKITYLNNMIAKLAEKQGLIFHIQIFYLITTNNTLLILLKRLGKTINIKLKAFPELEQNVCLRWLREDLKKFQQISGVIWTLNYWIMKLKYMPNHTVISLHFPPLKISPKNKLQPIQLQE